MRIQLQEYRKIYNRLEAQVSIHDLTPDPDTVIHASLSTDVSCACGTNIETDPEHIDALVRVGLNEVAKRVIALVQQTDAVAEAAAQATAQQESRPSKRRG